MYRATIKVTCRDGVLDCQGQAVGEALQRLDLAAVGRTRVGRWVEVDVDVTDRAAAERAVDEMCRRLLAHPVVEDYRFDLEVIS